MYIEQCQKAIQAFQRGFTAFAETLSKTDSLERLLRVIQKGILLYAEIKNTREEIGGSVLVNVSRQVKSSREILKVVVGVHLMQRSMCPNKKGEYFFRKATWQKCAGRISLLFYYLLSNAKLAAKLELVQIRRLNTVIVGRLPLLNLLTEGSYILYTVLAAREGARKTQWFYVAISIGKIFVAVVGLALEAFSCEIPLCALSVNALSFTLDVISMTKTLWHSH